MGTIIRSLFFLCLLALTQCAPHFIVTPPKCNVVKRDLSKEGDLTKPDRPLKVYEMDIHTNVSNRFAHTLVTSRVKNFGNESKETAFSVILPETAYISGFVLEIDGKKYEAYVKPKEEAKNIYNQAVMSGQSAAHVSASARDSNRFDVTANVEPQSKAAFYLSYEELLQRRNEQYEIVINIHPGQPVKDLTVQVDINESRPLKFVRAPALRSGNEIISSEVDLDPRAVIANVSKTTAVVKFSPNEERQKELAHNFGTKEEDGLSGQFVVQYDVDRDHNGGEILLQDGYFVHFFAPSDVPALPKHIVFVLDTSGSMYDRKIEQLKQAMKAILHELKDTDLFDIVEFNTFVKVWDLNNKTVNFPTNSENDYWYSGPSHANIESAEFRPALKVSPENIKKADGIINSLYSNGGTNIFVALKVALRLVQLTSQNIKEESRQPLVMFLTDGEPTVDISNTDEIVTKITEINDAQGKTPIFSLSFGDGADKNFLQKLSLHNNGFSRHIYEAADASLQLEEFYKQISSPLLSNVTFKYTPSVSNLTKTNFPILFGGGELVVSGKVEDKEFGNYSPEVTGFGKNGTIQLHPTISRPVTHLERLWSYLTVKQILEAKEIATKKEPYDKMALDLSLKYSFVTPVSSLVVVKPNKTDAPRDVVAADKPLPVPVPFSANTRFVGGFPATTNFYQATLHSMQAVPNRYHSAGHISSYSIQSLAVPRPSIKTSLKRLPVMKTLKRQHFGLAYAPVPPMSPFRPEEDSDTVVEQFATTSDTVVEQFATTEQLPALTHLEDQLPWLSKIIENKNNISYIKIANETLKLGRYDTVSSSPECHNTPTNTTGNCRLLKDCTQVFDLLTDVTKYTQAFCRIDEYAGVCCPKDGDGDP